jgi:hypothetical protein
VGRRRAAVDGELLAGQDILPSVRGGKEVVRGQVRTVHRLRVRKAGDHAPAQHRRRMLGLLPGVPAIQVSMVNTCVLSLIATFMSRRAMALVSISSCSALRNSPPSRAGTK